MYDWLYQMYLIDVYIYNVKSLLTLVTLFHINLLLELGHNMF